MEIRNHTEFRETVEYLSLRSILGHLRLDVDDLLGRFFNKLNDRGVTSVYTTSSTTIMGNSLLTATFKTVAGNFGLKVYRQSRTDIFDVSVIDLSTNTTTYLFTLQSAPVD